jgi:LacI family transcriptional regulator
MRATIELGMARLTANDVARLAGVSVGTVSRVINKNPTVAPEARRKVEAAIAQLGWYPNAVARSMRTATTRMIGCIFSDIRNPLYASIIKGAEEALSAQGYVLMVASSGENPYREAALIDLFAGRRADGLLLSLADESSQPVIDAIAAANIPTVLVERDLPLEVASVGTDHRAGMKRATEYLISLGHRRIALITGGQKNRAGRERLRGYLDAMQDAELAVDQNLLRLDSLSSHYAFNETQHLLGLAEPPTAIISGGNQMLAGVLRAARLKCVDIPGQLSVINSGDTELAELATPPVTAIRWDLEAVGREGATILLKIVGGAAARSLGRTELPNEIILRQSCAPPRSGPLTYPNRRGSE